jgi:hypothetical protein
VSYGEVQSLELKQQYNVKISNMVAAMEHLNAEVNTDSASETIRKNIKMSAQQS